jgi:transposase
MNTRVIGIDLAVTAVHKAIVLDAKDNKFVSRVLNFRDDPASMKMVLDAARKNAPEDLRLVAILEATGMSWLTVGQYFQRHGVEVYRINGQRVSDFRKVYKRHAKSDRIDIRVLARLYLIHPERLHRLAIPSGESLALQRACRERARLVKQSTANKNRLVATDKFAFVGFSKVLPPYGERAFWIRRYWYNPWKVAKIGPEALTLAWQKAFPHRETEIAWITELYEQAQLMVALYGNPTLAYDFLQEDLHREQSRLQKAQTQIVNINRHVIRPLYRNLHPHRHLETLQGIGEDSAAIYIAFINDITRFPTVKQFRAWSGMIPYSSQSGHAEAKGLHITQAGPDLIKATAYLNAQVARLYDPQIAKIYYDQMLIKGKHHNQAICACATHLLSRIYAILKENRPYLLQDTEGKPVTKREARLICRKQFHVPDKVRNRNNQRTRKAKRENKIEHRYQKRYKN